MRARALAVAALLLAIFLLVALAMARGWTHGPDEYLLALFRRADPRHALAAPDWVLPVAVGITTLGAAVARVPLTAVPVVVLLAIGRRRAALLLLAAVAGGAVVLELAKHLFARARPDLAWRLVREGNFSFPSGHSMGSMILYPLLGWLIARSAGRGPLGAALGVALAIAIGCTRVLLGVHWASDVVAGWSLGAAWALAAAVLMAPPPLTDRSGSAG